MALPVRWFDGADLEGAAKKRGPKPPDGLDKAENDPDALGLVDSHISRLTAPNSPVSR